MVSAPKYQVWARSILANGQIRMERPAHIQKYSTIEEAERAKEIELSTMRALHNSFMKTPYPSNTSFFIKKVV